MAEAPSRLELDGATLAYRQSGTGPDIVWLAAGDNPGDNWRRYQTPAFDDAYRSTTYDARGVGATRSSTEPPWPIVEHAADLAALIEAVCEPPVFLVGLSMGSLIAVQIAHDRPELVRAALVMGTCVRKTGFIREWEQAEIDFRRQGGTLPPAFATAHYAMQYFPADALGDDATWERIKPFVAADFADRDGAMLAAQWQACLDYDSGRAAAADRGSDSRDRVLRGRADAAAAGPRGRRARRRRPLPPAPGPWPRLRLRSPPRCRQRAAAGDRRAVATAQLTAGHRAPHR